MFETRQKCLKYKISFQAELDLTPEQEKMLYDQPIEKKRLMLTEQNIVRNKYEIGDFKSCDEYIYILKSLENNFLEDDITLTTLDALAVSLRTQSHSFVQKFVETGGVTCLESLLNHCRNRSGRDAQAATILQSFKALLNSSVGRSAVLSSSSVLSAVASSLYFHYVKCKILCFEILAGICLIPDGHQKVLYALTNVSEVLGERTRFQTVVNDLHRKYRSERNTQRVRTAAMSLINALLSTGPAETSLEVRLHLRVEFLMLGLQSVVEKLRDSSSSVLNDHLDFFEMSRQDDEQHFLRSGTSTPVDLENACDITDLLVHRLDSTLALPHFISLLQHLLLVPIDGKNIYVWKFFDILLQQLSLQMKLNQNLDVQQPTISFDVNEIISRMHTQEDYENLEKMYKNLEEELRRERTNVLELQNRLCDSDSHSVYSRTSIDSSPSDPRQSPSPNLLSPVTQTITQHIAPPPPPPIPKIDHMVISGLNIKDSVKKSVPKPLGLLKTLNWTVIPNDRIPGTVWEKIDDEKLYQQMDLQEICLNFAINKSSEDAESVSETLKRRFRNDTTISVIESRRAQNCTIMLSKLRLSNKQIKRAVLSMDEYGELPRDMIEQMLKFLPTKEEVQQIQSVVEKYKTPTVLAVADRFLFEISNIPRYEQRLRCLHIICTFRERLDDVAKSMQAVANASVSVASSKRLRTLLSVVLAIGNYLNYEKRNGNASGFMLISLRELSDVKNTLRADRNLLHYIIELIEHKYPDVLRFKRDLSNVYDAARQSRVEIEQELNALRKSIATVTEELKNGEAVKALNAAEAVADTESPNSADATDHSADRFLPTLRNFHNTAKGEFANAEKLFEEMNKKFASCVKHYGEEATKCSPDEFFGVFSKFLNSFTECHHQLWQERENIERIKKQTIAPKKNDNRGRDFDQLVTALQSGEIFFEELSRLRSSYRSRKKPKK
uniref:GBD/FH3 domain-containing protein n=1 Tax=Syphacia muris TaxID=451379 RepID=A0A158R3X5_9BILA